MEKYPGGNNEVEHEKDFLDSFDLERFWYVFKWSKFWIIGFVVLTTVLSYLYIRYTKPTYKSESIVKLDFKSEANILGITNVLGSQDRNELSGEIQLIKSKLFLSRVVDRAQLNVSYHLYGRYLTEERYKNSPFIVSYKILDERFYDKPIDLEIIDENSFNLIYEANSKEVSETYLFGQEIKSKYFNFLIEKTSNLNESLNGTRFYFTINSERAKLNFIQSNLEVAPENFNAKSIKISFSDYNAAKARDLVVIIDSLYLDYTKEVKNQAAEQKIMFLDKQIEQTELTLGEFEEYFERFTIENRTTNLGGDLNRTINQLAKIDSQQFILKSRLAYLDVVESQIEENGMIDVDPLSTGSLPGLLRSKLVEYTNLQQQRELKLASYNETSYLIERLDLQMENTVSELAELLKSYRKLLNEQFDESDKRRLFYESSLYQLPSMGTEYTKKKRIYNLQENLLLSFLTSKMELEIALAGTVTDSIILSSATLPTTPVKPQKLLIIVAGFMIGLVFGIIFLLINYLIHNKIAGIRELEKIVKIPVLGGVPDHNTKLEHTGLVVDNDSTSSISEALRTIRTNMDFLGNGKKTKVISITSTISGEGKTFVAVNLGAIMSMSGKKVVVVDFDMRRPKIHMAFNSGNQAEGVSTILSGKCEIKESIQETSIHNLSYIPSGPTPPNPSELLLQNEFEVLIDQLEKKFDIVILDTPPVGLVTDGRIIMKRSDIQLYIVRADFSKRSFVKVMNDLHATNQYKNMATILNSIHNTPVYGYGYGYGYGYYEEEKSKMGKITSGLKSLF